MMKVTSTSFGNQQTIPARYGCMGDNISPQIAWSDFPKETKSFALICHDPDSPSGNFIHWVVANIPANITVIEEGAMTVSEADNLANDFGKPSYGGPCPGSGKHHYIFSIYALDTEKIENVNKDNLISLIEPHILDQGQIVGLYQK